MSEPPEPEPTEALLAGRYRLGDVIGRGGMSTVYRAHDTLLERTVAVKILRDGSDAATPERARTEMTVLAGLNHPSLVTLYDADIGPGRTNYLVMECVEGPSLADRLQRGPVPPGDLALILAELADALQLVHASGVVHRDIKPSNVLLAPFGAAPQRFRAKLADFGVAYLVDGARHTTPGIVIGTGAYLAPEQVRGEQLTPAADIYALGLMAIEALTGTRAYPHATGIGAVLARLASPPSIPDGLGRRWTSLLSRMTSDDPDARPDAAEVARIAETLPADVRPIVRPAPVAAAAADATQPFPAAATLPVRDAAARDVPAATPAAAHVAHRRAPQRRLRRRLLVGGAVVCLVLLVSLGAWALTAAGGVGVPRVPVADEPSVAPSPTPAAVTEADTVIPGGTDTVDAPPQDEDESSTQVVDAPDGSSGEAPATQTVDAPAPGSAVDDAPAAPAAPAATDGVDKRAEQEAAKAARDAERAAEGKGTGPGSGGKPTPGP